jgi:hypothetical protein
VVNTLALNWEVPGSNLVPDVLLLVMSETSIHVVSSHSCIGLCVLIFKLFNDAVSTAETI